MIRGTLTVRETADYLGIRPCTVREWARLGILPHLRIQRRILFRLRTLDKFLESRESAGKTSSPLLHIAGRR